MTIGTSGSGLPRCRSQCLNPEGASARPPSDRRLIPSDPGSSRLPCLFPVLLAAMAVVLLATPGWAQEQKEAAYRAFPYVGSRLAIWVIAQIHLNFAAFILGVPIFAVIIEFMAWRIGTDREEGRRYDWLSHEFVKLTFAAFSTTALLGGLLLFLLITLYPRFWAFMSGIFAPTMWLYAALFFLETFTVYLWYYGWNWLSGPRKGLHVAIGVLSNLLGTAILFVSNSWVTFMISPAGVDDAGQFTGTLWQAVNNFTWMPVNIHRLIANVVFGGTIAAAYAAFRFLGAKTDEERARYDWMGYIGNFVALSALMVLPFAGYWLGFEIYGYNQTMGITMMGGFMSWLWIVQAILIGVLFLGSNYYLWLGMERIPGAERFRPWIKYLLARDRARIHGLGDSAEPHRLARRGPRDGRLGPPVPPVLRRHVGEEHRREPDDPDDVPLVSPLPAGQQAAHGVLGPDRDGPPVAHLRPRRARPWSGSGSGATSSRPSSGSGASPRSRSGRSSCAS